MTTTVYTGLLIEDLAPMPHVHDGIRTGGQVLTVIAVHTDHVRAAALSKRGHRIDVSADQIEQVIPCRTS
jgi:hypothetical protein